MRPARYEDPTGRSVAWWISALAGLGTPLRATVQHSVSWHGTPWWIDIGCGDLGGAAWISGYCLVVPLASLWKASDCEGEEFVLFGKEFEARAVKL